MALLICPLFALCKSESISRTTHNRSNRVTGSSRISGVVRLLVLVTLALGSSRLLAATRIDLNGQWQFRTDAANEGEKAGWTSALPSSTESVQVPHTWNVGEHEDYMGRAWYFRTFRRPDIPLGKHVELHFGATFYKSRVWFNGK